jgi:hypothetical protein
MQRLRIQDALDRGSSRLVQGRVTGLQRMHAHMPCECRACPQLRGIPEFPRLATRQMDHPGLGIIGNDRLSRLMRRVLHAGPLQHALAGHLQGARGTSRKAALCDWRS